jgi:hypothetical protein
MEKLLSVDNPAFYVMLLVPPAVDHLGRHGRSVPDPD